MPQAHGKENHNRRRQKRKPSKFAYFLMFAVVACCAVLICSKVFLKVKDIKVTGKTQYSAAEIIKGSGITSSSNLLSIDREKVSRRLSSSLPFILKANVHLVLPTTVKIEILEDSPAYFIKTGSGYAIADKNLKALEVSKKQPGGITEITGAEISKLNPGQAIKFMDEKLELIKELTSAVEKAKMSKITGFDVTNSYQLAVVYDSRIKIIIGTKSGACDKLEDAKVIITSKIQSNEKGSLDVSAQDKRFTFSPS